MIYRFIITISVTLFPFVTSGFAQCELVNNAVRITDSLLAHEAFVDSEYGIVARPTPHNCISINLDSDLVIGDIDNLGLLFKYSVDSTECHNSVSISISKEEDFFGYYGCPYLLLVLRYRYFSQLPSGYPISINILWAISFFTNTNNSILKYEVVQLCD